MAHVAQAGSMYWLIIKKFRKLKICMAMFLKKAFSSLEGNELHFLQSVLQDLHVLQPWTRPLDFKELNALQEIDDSLQWLI